MAKGVFIHRSDSIYDDVPSERYQFPRQYLGRVQDCVGDWIIYLEPSKVSQTRGYFAIAKVQQVIPDASVPDMFTAVIEKDSYLDFGTPVAFNEQSGPIERGLLNEAGKLSGRAQSAVRPISNDDFNRIVDAGLFANDRVLPRVDDDSIGFGLAEEQTSFELDMDRPTVFAARSVRDQNFRRIVLRTYDNRCCISGLKLINGGGRAEAEAAHIRSVEHGGPDIVTNGLALSGTVHWMFDRGLISVADNLEILISRQANDQQTIRDVINDTGYLIPPIRERDRPHPQFLNWHRENCFKQ